MISMRKWDRNGIKVPREKIFRWRVINSGQEDERAECECCGAGMSKLEYGYKHSLPLACPKCFAQLCGYECKEAE